MNNKTVLQFRDNFYSVFITSFKLTYTIVINFDKKSGVTIGNISLFVEKVFQIRSYSNCEDFTHCTRFLKMVRRYFMLTITANIYPTDFTHRDISGHALSL